MRHRTLPAAQPLTLLLSRVVQGAHGIAAMLSHPQEAPAHVLQLDESRRAAAGDAEEVLLQEERPFLLPDNRDLIVDAARHTEHALADLTRAAHAISSIQLVGLRLEPRRMAELIAWSAAEMQGAVALGVEGDEAAGILASARHHLLEVDELRDAALGALFGSESDPMEVVRWRAVLDALDRPATELMAALAALELAVREEG